MKIGKLLFALNLILCVGIQKGSYGQTQQSVVIPPCHEFFDDDIYIHAIGYHGNSENASMAIEEAMDNASLFMVLKVLNMYPEIAKAISEAIESGDWVCSETQQQNDGSFDAYVALEISRDRVKQLLDLAIKRSAQKIK